MENLSNRSYPPGAGVLTIVHGQKELATMAVALARSIRLRDPDLPLAVVTNFDPALFEGMFDYVIPWDFSRWTYFDAKLDMYAMSPFETTIFLDADILVYRSLADVFICFEGDDFGVVGHNVKDLGWFASMDLIRREFPSDTYCYFNGGIYFFRRSEVAAAIFERAMSIYERYDELKVYRHTSCKAEQRILCLAMVEAGIKARRPGSGRGYLIDAFWPTGCRIEKDVLSGICVQTKLGRMRGERVFLHFVGVLKSSYGYLFESLRLKWAFRYGRRGRDVDFILRIYALFLWRKNIPGFIVERGRTSVKQIKSRIRQMLGRGSD